MTLSQRASRALRTSPLETGAPPVLSAPTGGALYRSMVESAPAYFYVADPSNAAATIYRSPQAISMLGYSLETWSDNPNLWVEILHPADRDRVITEITAGMEGRKPFRSEYRIRTSSGVYLWVRDHGTMVVNPTGPGMIFQGVVMDITEQMDAVRDYHKARFESEAKSRALASMSHELRTPLNSILGFSQLLQAGIVAGELNERQRHYIDNVVKSGEHLLDLVNDVLDLAKSQSGQVDLILESVVLDEAVARALSTVRPLAGAKALSLSQEASGGSLVRADPQRLHQVLLNLLSNAIKFTEIGEIAISSDATEDGWVAVTVADTGIGISTADQALIFDEFVQLGSSWADGQRGIGLGLSLTRSFVEAMGGTISTVSEPGVGSRFTFRLAAA